MNPTDEQLAIIAAAANGSSFAVYAGAGTGKTSTIKMLAGALPSGSTLAVAFNKRIAMDLEQALPKGTMTATLNSLGHRAWGAQRGGRLELNANKIGDLTGAAMKEHQIEDEDGSIWTFVRKGVDHLRMNNVVPLGAKKFSPIWSQDSEQILGDYFMQNEAPEIDLDFAADIIEGILVESIRLAYVDKEIDFLDQIYMTTSFRAQYSSYRCVIVDEAQDLSPANHRQLMLMQPKQLIAVGDPKQAIYAFRGADSSSMDTLRNHWNAQSSEAMQTFPLATTFRCPKAVVKRQKEHYPEYIAAPEAPEGLFQSLDAWSIADIPRDSAIICRLNAPLVNMAFLCLANGRGFTFLGQDMAKNLKGLIKKIAGYAGKNLTKKDKQMLQSAILAKHKVWHDTSIAEAKAKNKPELVAGIQDRSSCARTIIKNSATLGEMMDYCDVIFSSAEPGLTLTTGHRSKGFEWDNVFHLDPWRIPSKFAIRAAEAGDYSQLQQERNLKYVIETRTKKVLTNINMDQNTDKGADIDEELDQA